MASNAQEVRGQFSTLAVQYYVAGRTATFHQLMPVLGNLLHHAVEMALKAALASTHSLQQLKKLGHKLPAAWRAFKAMAPVDSPRFDSVVEELHRFEELRYPDSILERGALMELALLREHMGERHSEPTDPRYTLILEDVDELMKHIFHVAGINPLLYRAGMTPAGKDFMLRENRHSSGW